MRWALLEQRRVARPQGARLLGVWLLLVQRQGALFRLQGQKTLLFCFLSGDALGFCLSSGELLGLKALGFWRWLLLVQRKALLFRLQGQKTLLFCF